MRPILFPLLSRNRSFVHCVWHGGEITQVKPSYLLKALWLQERYRPTGVSVSNSLQTNGTRLSEEWLDLLELAPISVGVSIDGPPEINDKKRTTQGGGATADLVLQGLMSLRNRGIPYGVLTVIDRRALQAGVDRYLRWLIYWDIHYVDFLNVAPAEENIATSRFDQDFVPIDQYVEWLVEFRRAQRRLNAIDQVRIRLLDDFTSSLVNNRKPKGCYFSGTCFSDMLNINPDGLVAPCDKYVSFESFATRNIDITKIDTVVKCGIEDNVTHGSGRHLVDFGSCKCRWRSYCGGSCPSDTFVISRYHNIERLQCCGLAPLFELAAQEIALAPR